MINELAKQVHENAKAHGFFDKEKNIGEMLCLIHSEVSEALEADRKGKYLSQDVSVSHIYYNDEDDEFQYDYANAVKGSFEEELADIIIRVMDLAAFKNIDLEAQIGCNQKGKFLNIYRFFLRRFCNRLKVG